jgi:hypothetical protein
VRYLATATTAASVLAIGLTMEPAFSLPLGAKVTTPDTAIQAQMKEPQQKGPRGGEGPGKGGPTVQGPGAAGGNLRGESRQFRSEKGVRSERQRTGERSTEHRRRAGRPGFSVEIGPGYYGYGPGYRRGYGYGPGCGWLRQRALETGSPYWWRRYHACRG